MATNTFFAAQVINSNAATRAITVIAESHAGGNSPHMGYMLQAVPITSLLTHFLGFSDCSLPQPGTRVLCVSDSADMCYILGSIPQETLNYENIPARALLGAGYARSDSAHCSGHESYTTHVYDNRRPQDVVDGEHVIANEFGVLLGLYQQLAVLKASELSQVQCFILDDLVRIISHNYQHYTALGEYNIYHDGRHITAEFGATHKPAESYGQPAVFNDRGAKQTFSEGGAPSVNDSSDFYNISGDERTRAIERLKIILGSVGDFLHMFLVRPDPDTVRNLSGGGGKPDTGLCDFHVGTDGGLHMRSVKEVFIEKTNWIRVPNRKRSPEDPGGDDGENMQYSPKGLFGFNNGYQYANNPLAYGLQIRDYVAYVNEQLTYQNCKQQSGDFDLSSSISEETPLPEVKHIDAETQLNLDDYKLRTAGIYLMPNGGITIRDAWSSAIVMEGGMIYLQPAKDLISQPLRNNIVKAGGNINMACKKHIDLSSTEEGIRLKSETSQYIYSNTGGIVLEAKSLYDVPAWPDPDAAALQYVGGIVLKSNVGIYSYAGTNIAQYAKGKLLLQSLHNTDIVADKVLTVYGKKYTQIFSDKSITAFANRSITLFSTGSAALAGTNSTALGQRGKRLGVRYDKKSKFVDILWGALNPESRKDEFEQAKTYRKYVLHQTIFQDPLDSDPESQSETLDKIKFRFLESFQYGELNPGNDFIPATMAQQDNLLTNIHQLVNWNEFDINGSMPYPGASLFNNFYLSSGAPINLEVSGSVGNDANNVGNPTAGPTGLSLTSLGNYLVQA